MADSAGVWIVTMGACEVWVDACVGGWSFTMCTPYLSS